MTASENGNGYISRGNMTVMLSAAGLVMLAFGAFMTNQNNATDRRMIELRDDVKELQKTALGQKEHEEFKLRIDKDIARMESRRLSDKEEVVPRKEHDARWAATDNSISLLSTRLNELRTATTSTYTLRDEIGRLQIEIGDLRKQINDRAK